MRKWQVDTTPYRVRRNELVSTLSLHQRTVDARQALRDFATVIGNFDGMLMSISEMNWRYRFQERTPQGYRKAVTRLDQCLDEVEQLATIFLLTFCSE